MIAIRPFDLVLDSLDELATLNELPFEAQRRWREDLARRLNPDNVLVAVDDGHLVGMIMLLDGGLPSAVTEGLYVRPDHRGQGVMRGLVEAVVAEYRHRGITHYFRFGDAESVAKFDHLGVPANPTGIFRMNGMEL